MATGSSRDDVLGSLLADHGLSVSARDSGPVPPDPHLTGTGDVFSPFRLLAFLKSQHNAPPKVDDRIDLEKQGHLRIKGIKCFKMAMSAFVKENTWSVFRCEGTRSTRDHRRNITNLFFKHLHTKTGCALIGNAPSTESGTCTPKDNMYWHGPPDGTGTAVHAFLAWKITFDAIKFDAKKQGQTLGVFYVYVRDTRAPRFCHDGYILAWFDDHTNAWDMIRNFERFSGRKTVPYISSSNPIPISAAAINACRGTQPPATSDNFWGVVMLPFATDALDAYGSCLSGSQSLLVIVAEVVLGEFFPPYARTSALALVSAWGGCDGGAGGINTALGLGGPIYRAASSFLGAQFTHESLSWFLHGLPPPFIRYMWTASPNSARAHRLLYSVASRRRHLSRLIRSTDNVTLREARCHSLVDIGGLLVHHLSSLLSTSSRDAMLDEKWASLLPFIAGKGVESVAAMLTRTRRLVLNRNVLSNLIDYTKRQVKAIQAVLSDTRAVAKSPEFAFGLVWIYTQAAISRDLSAASALVQDAPEVVEVYTRLIEGCADRDNPGCSHATLDASILAEHYAEVARLRRRAKKRKHALESELATDAKTQINALIDCVRGDGTKHMLTSACKRLKTTLVKLAESHKQNA